MENTDEGFMLEIYILHDTGLKYQKLGLLSHFSNQKKGGHFYQIMQSEIKICTNVSPNNQFAV